MLKTVKLYARKAWNWLTSMRTALALLFLLAIAAIPGALLPQRSLNESNVIEYIENNGKLAEFYDKIQLFNQSHQIKRYTNNFNDKSSH